MSKQNEARPQAGLVYHPVKVNGDKLRALLEAASAENGWAPPLIKETTPESNGTEQTQQLIEAGVKAVLVAGGDGTVRAVAQGMTSSEIPLAIVPSGTGNLFARNLKLAKLSPAEMINAVFNGETLKSDIGFTTMFRPDGSEETHAFVVMAGIGWDAEMIASTSTELKKAVGWVAYLGGAAAALPKAKAFPMMFQLDQNPAQVTRVRSVLCTNCGTLPAGINLAPAASLTDGKLDAILIEAKGWLGWFWLWRRVWWDNSFLQRFPAGRRALKRRGKDRALEYLVGTSFDIATVKPQQIELDGDQFGKIIRARSEIRKGQLLLVVPQGHNTEEL